MVFLAGEVEEDQSRALLPSPSLVFLPPAGSNSSWSRRYSRQDEEVYFAEVFNSTQGRLTEQYLIKDRQASTVDNGLH